MSCAKRSRFETYAAVCCGHTLTLSYRLHRRTLSRSAQKPNLLQGVPRSRPPLRTLCSPRSTPPPRQRSPERPEHGSRLSLLSAARGSPPTPSLSSQSKEACLPSALSSPAMLRFARQCPQLQRLNLKGVSSSLSDKFAAELIRACPQLTVCHSSFKLCSSLLPLLTLNRN